MGPPSSTPGVVVEDLTAGYNGMPVVQGLSLNADAGMVTALLGANGAGKTTTLLAIAGSLRPMGGRILIMGQPIGRRPCHQVVRMGVSLVPGGRGLLVSELTVGENLRLYTKRRTRQKINEVYDFFPPLRGLWSRRAGLLSGGEQQMLALACAISADSQVLLIDELSHGLAPVIVERLLPTVRTLAWERRLAVLMVEQHVDAALRVADFVYVLNRGHVVMAGSAAEIGGQADVVKASYLGSSVAPPDVKDGDVP
jgi:branched-chain amino acid transport system ATP-binding protein